MTEKTPWEVLSRIDVADKIEKKNGLSYLVGMGMGQAQGALPPRMVPQA